LLPSIVRLGLTGCSLCSTARSCSGYPPYNIERTATTPTASRAVLAWQKRAFDRSEGKHADDQRRETDEGREERREVLYQASGASFEARLQLADYVQSRCDPRERTSARRSRARVPRGKKPRQIPIARETKCRTNCVSRQFDQGAARFPGVSFFGIIRLLILPRCRRSDHQTPARSGRGSRSGLRAVCAGRSPRAAQGRPPRTGRREIVKALIGIIPSARAAQTAPHQRHGVTQLVADHFDDRHHSIARRPLTRGIDGPQA